ncbi:MAG: ABC transporter ATP-binding protein [Cyclobacteriaceae bacterium]|nr:MAG: ABC transporter ATP-binding protein [Cyclobacteriaceae bacterium]
MEKEKVTGKIVDFKILKRLIGFIKPYRGQFYLLVLLTIVTAVLGPIRPWIIQITIDDHISVGDYQGLVNMTLLLFGLLLLHAIVQYSHTYLSGLIGQNIIKDIRIQLYHHLLRLRLKFFDKTPIGRLVTRNVSDVETLAEVFSQGIAAMSGDILTILFILVFMLIQDWKLTLICLCTLPILIVSTYVFKEKIKVTFNNVRNAVSNLNSFVQEHITGMSVVQIFNNEEEEYKKFKEINREHKRANIRSVLYYAIYFPVAEIIGASSIGLLVWYGAGGVMKGTIPEVGILISFIMYINMFFRPIRMIADRFNTLQLGIVSTDRIVKLLDSKEFLSDEGTYEAESLKGKVTFNNVWFAYNEEDYVLKDISFGVQPGQALALVGATGAGKSSVINLLSRFYDINQGTIKIDDVSISEYKLQNLRANIGVVLQDVFLFSGSIVDNITLGNHEIPFEKVVEAAELVGARRFIERLPGGFNYNVMERGATLSVGQRQLISFVRAMVYNPRIVVLDEATSSVDTETEELIQYAIEKLMKGRTSIVIAHRLSTIQNADKILVMEKGEIKERGNHEQLLDLNGYYTQLYHMQYKGVLS